MYSIDEELDLHEKKANAFFELARSYRRGVGCKQNMDLAKEYYEKAVEYGSAKACMELGYVYTNGIKRDFRSLADYKAYLKAHGGKDIFKRQPKIAVELFLRAYELGYQKNENEYHPLELAFLSCKYQDADKEATAYFMQKLAGYMKKDIYATYILARCYDVGVGVKEDKDKAYRMYEYVIDNDIEDARIYMAWLCYKGVDKEGKYSAFKLFKELAKEDLAEAYYGLSKCYLEGRGIKQDSRKAVELLKTGIQKGYSDCDYQLGKLYLSGDYGVEQDQELGVELLTEGLLKNNQRCALALAEYYYNKNTPEDMLKAMQCLRIAEYRHSNIAKEWINVYCVNNKLSQKELYEKLDENPLGLERNKYTRRV